MTRINIVFPFLLLLLIVACNKNNNQVVLKIGQLEITKYEFERSKSRFLSGFASFKNEKEKTVALKNWKKNYIEKYIVIADAYSKGMDTLSSINAKVDRTSKFMVVQQYGYLWQKMVSPIVDEFKTVTPDKIEKRKKLYYFDYIFCYNLPELLSYTQNDTILKSLDDFNRLKNRCSANSHFKTGYMSQQWPFYSFWKFRDALYNMKEGEITHLLIIDGNYAYLYLDHIENIEVDESDKLKLQTELQLGMESEIDKKTTLEIEEKCKPELNMENINVLFESLDKGIELKDIATNYELMTYQMESTNKKLDFNTFRDFVNSLPFETKFIEKQDLTELIKQYCYDDYLNLEAIQQGIYEVDSFVLDRKMYKNGLLYSTYLQKNIFDNIKIDSNEIIKYYNEHTAMFQQPETIICDLYLFDYKSDALRNYSIISDRYKNNVKIALNDNLVGLTEIKYDYHLSCNSTGELSESFIDALLAVEKGTLSTKPIKYKDQFALIFKKDEEGKYYPNYNEIQDKLMSLVKAEKMVLLNQATIDELKKKYKIEFDKTDMDD